MQDKVARGDFDINSFGDGELSDGAIGMINGEMAEKELQNQIAQDAGGPVYEEYDAYNSDALCGDDEDPSRGRGDLFMMVVGCDGL